MTEEELYLLGSLRNRLQVMYTFEELGDIEIQKTWVNPKYKHSFWDTLCMYVLEPMFDDWAIDEDTESLLGYMLYNEEEVEVIGNFSRYLFDLVNKRIRGNQPDSAYLDHPEWPYVVEKSREIYELMKRNNEIYDYDRVRDALEEQDMLEAQQRAALEEEKKNKPSSGES